MAREGLLLNFGSKGQRSSSYLDFELFTVSLWKLNFLLAYTCIDYDPRRTSCFGVKRSKVKVIFGLTNFPEPRRTPIDIHISLLGSRGKLRKFKFVAVGVFVPFRTDLIQLTFIYNDKKVSIGCELNKLWGIKDKYMVQNCNSDTETQLKQLWRVIINSTIKMNNIDNQPIYRVSVSKQDFWTEFLSLMGD